MRFYADTTDSREPRALLHDLEHTLRAMDAPGAPVAAVAGASRIDAVREALIAAGMLEQAVADGLPENAPALRRCIALTDRCADALLHAGAGGPTAILSAASFAMEALRNESPLAVTLPEGYLFYALFPERYADGVPALLAGVPMGTPIVVIGIRSIGTSLSALVAAALRAGGRPVRRATVRPHGDPFSREIRPSAAERVRWSAAAHRGARFLVVDEGPGVSGSSIASVVAALRGVGVSPPHIGIVCAHAPTALPLATAATRALWSATAWFAADDGEGFWRDALPASVAASLGRPLEDCRDLSWGAWSDRAHQPVPLPQLERRKLLLTIDGQAVLAKFIGFGETGRRKAALNAQLAVAGLVAPVLGWVHGMLLQRWEAPAGGLPLRSASPPLERAAQYYAHLRLHMAHAAHADHAAVSEIVGSVARDWFGDALPGDPRRLLARMRGAQRQCGDQRPEPVEWIVAGDRAFKCDAGDHFLDHTWAREMDSAFDLAGFAIEHGLSCEQQHAFLAHYCRLSGDTAIGTRLPFFRAVYAAHRLAGFDTAYHAAPPHTRATLDRARHAMADTLGNALIAGGADACVC